MAGERALYDYVTKTIHWAPIKQGSNATDGVGPMHSSFTCLSLVMVLASFATMYIERQDFLARGWYLLYRTLSYTYNSYKQ